MAKIILNEDGTASFTINVIGFSTKDSYQGLFKVKCLLNPLQELAVSRLNRELIGDKPEYADQNTSQLAFALTQLSERVVEAPPFWNTGDELPGNIKDANVIVEVLELAIEAQEKFLKQKQDEYNKNQELIKKLVTQKVKETSKEEEEEE